MNRQGVGPQHLRGLPNGFGNQQQVQQNRGVSNRIPQPGKIVGNNSTWAFGGGVPMGSAGLNATRQNPSSMTSFAQTIGGGSSQPATPLDLSEFPSLSNNQSQPSQPIWSTSNARNLSSSANLRNQAHQEDVFGASPQLASNQSGFRYGSQNAVGQPSQTNNVDEFPPLNRNGNGDIGDRPTGVQSVGFGASSNSMGFGSTAPAQPNRGANGLLSAVSGSSRIGAGNRVTSPGNISGIRPPVENASRQGESSIDLDPQAENSVPRSQTADSGIASLQGPGEEADPEFFDPLAGMSELDRWGLKGFSTLMSNYPSYAALVVGRDVSNMGFDLNSSEPLTTMQYSLFDSDPARPVVSKYELPECYTVHNVAALENKISNFNEEALMFMFYSNPGDIQQAMAAQELHSRNWRYHKKLQLWLTKDDMMVPQPLGSGSERGYYLFFDIHHWERSRREFTLVYDELESLPNGPRPLA
ncbi:hypothetical protein B0O99DRAFT_224611 [Bisporella sp. PMI_857]|nr:hypothetical protein B0O99DRAFT_224611 [Bisporella sp. PMI_857]